MALDDVHAMTSLPTVLPSAAKDEVRQWCERVGVDVLSDPLTEETLATLLAKGCDPVTLLDMLGHFCGLTMRVAATREKAKRFLKRAKKLAIRLKQDANEVRNVEQQLQLGVSFPKAMEHYSEYLSGFYTESVKASVLSRGSGLQASLIDAVTLIKMATGRPHYREITQLVSAMSGRTEDEVGLRKKVQNFRCSTLYGPTPRQVLRKVLEHSRTKCDAFRRHGLF